MERFRKIALDVMTNKVICYVCNSADARTYFYPDGERSLCHEHVDDFCNRCGDDLAGQEESGLFASDGTLTAILCEPCAQ